MFSFRIARAKSIQTEKPKLLFTMSRGAHLTEKIGNKILFFVVEKERIINGEQPNGKAIITGVKVSTEDIKKVLILPTEFVFGEVHVDSLPIVKLANKAGMTQIGLFKDLSPIFACTLE